MNFRPGCSIGDYAPGKPRELIGIAHDLHSTNSLHLAVRMTGVDGTTFTLSSRRLDSNGPGQNGALLALGAVLSDRDTLLSRAAEEWVHSRARELRATVFASLKAMRLKPHQSISECWVHGFAICFSTNSKRRDAAIISDDFLLPFRARISGTGIGTRLGLRDWDRKHHSFDGSGSGHRDFRRNGWSNIGNSEPKLSTLLQRFARSAHTREAEAMIPLLSSRRRSDPTGYSIRLLRSQIKLPLALSVSHISRSRSNIISLADASNEGLRRRNSG